VSAIPKGEATKRFNDLAERLRALGLFVAEVGELEGFVPSIGSHGRSWIGAVLERDLASDPELEPARKFVAGVTATTRETDAKRAVAAQKVGS
jgi:hypothetical protein